MRCSRYFNTLVTFTVQMLLEFVASAVENEKILTEFIAKNGKRMSFIADGCSATEKATCVSNIMDCLNLDTGMYKQWQPTSKLILAVG